MKRILKKLWKIGGLLALMSGPLLSQTTGKIAGKILDGGNGEPLPGVNIIVAGTDLGAASDGNGDFYILNVTPGIYDLHVQMIGYEKQVLKGVQVSVNRTSYYEVSLKTTVISGQEVIVQADRISQKKDQTSSVRHMSAESIEAMPVENLGAVVNMQAGVVNGHFRGGRSTEVSYMIDGVPVDDAFGGEAQVVGIETESIQDLEVITGTFNAEYGRAMSGVVNAVTKEGGDKFEVNAGIERGIYVTGNDDIWPGINSSDADNVNMDYKFQISGPLLTDRLTFFTNVRMQQNNNYLNGIRRFNPDNYSNYMMNPPYYSEALGDSAYVPMGDSENLSVMSKVAFKPFTKMKLSFLYNYADNKWRGYDHIWKYNPDGLNYQYSTTAMYTVTLNHMLSNRFFYEFKYSTFNNYYGNYMYEDPLDERYIHTVYLENAGSTFFTGGMSHEHNERTQINENYKLDMNWQANVHHSLKWGVQRTEHTIDNSYMQIRNALVDIPINPNDPVTTIGYFDIEQGKYIFPNWEAEVLGDTSVYSDIYTADALEMSAYLQDKMEFDEMVINVGIRYDHFDPQTVYATDLRNPANQYDLPDSMMSEFPAADVKTQISPRFGLAYRLSDVAILRFSYGHFFQMPPFYALYTNHTLRVAPGDYETLSGNPQLEAQKTVSYEIGLWQELMPGMGVEVALFYRDIYDLLSTRVISTYNQTEYGQYTNKDYGNARGLEVKYDFHRNGLFANVNYTLQYTRGNADNPQQTYDRSGDSMDPIQKLIPMSWDQRHTFNASIGYSAPVYGLTATGYFNSGTPYTYTPIEESRLYNINLPPNNDQTPARYSVDLNGYINFKLPGGMKFQLTLAVYNLLDRLNAAWVYSDTGLPYTTIVRDSELLSHHAEFTDYYDYIQNPAMYAAPRYVKVGLSVDL